METGSLAIVLSDFFTTVDGELSLNKGEYFLVHNIIDKHWVYGQSQDKMGKFPSGRLLKVDLPELKEGEKIFIATASFMGEQKGDLSFKPGEMIIGIGEIESDWYLGKINSMEGIFPITHTWELDSSMIKNVSGKKSVNKRARVKTNLKAQLTEELDLTEGDIIEVTEILGDGWCRGSNSNDPKKIGIFPEQFITYLEEDCSEIIIDEDPSPNYYDLFPESNDIEEVKPHAITLYPFNAQFPNELSFQAGKIVYLSKHIDSEWIEGSINDFQGIFPASYVNIIVDCSENQNNNNEENKEETIQYDTLEIGSTVKVEFTFQAQMSGDLSVLEGDLVEVVETANKDWINVKNKDGLIGLCPRGYLKAITSLEEDLPIENNESKRLSEPHRPAPPAPVPGSVPLNNDKEIITKPTITDQRENVTSELLVTEKEYIRDLKLTYETFHLYDPTHLESYGINVKILFGNVLEIIKVAEDLLDMLFKSIKNSQDNHQSIGYCFVSMADQLKQVYGKYCANQEAALVLLSKYKTEPEITAIFNKGLESLRGQIACFDMSSILIKPVQRITKYPLMLYELIKCTEDDHPDKSSLEEAWKCMTDVASHVNEYKRCRDLIDKYLDTDTYTIRRKMTNLNVHSVVKLTSRLSIKLSASLGLKNIVTDPEFEELAQRLKNTIKCTHQLLKDVEQCLNCIEEESLAGEVLSDYLVQFYQSEPNQEVQKFRDIRSIIWSQYKVNLKFHVDQKVTKPLNTLAELLEGPELLIAKRYDKLLDYDAVISRQEKYKDSRTAQDELYETKTNYEALNQQLLEELPILIDASTKVIISCVKAFAQARKLFTGRITMLYLSLCENNVPPPPQGIIESFLVRHNIAWNQMTRFTFSNQNDVVDNKEPIKPKLMLQTDKHKELLKANYSQDKLYQVISNVLSISELDITARRDTLVAVLKKQDPMGDTSRWFVYDGTIKGFIPSEKLRPFQNEVPDLISMESPVKDNSQRYQNLPTFYHAKFDFANDLPGTLQIKKRQALKLIKPYDEKNNCEWWLMENRDGHTGYVPYNYLESSEDVKQ